MYNKDAQTVMAIRNAAYEFVKELNSAYNRGKYYRDKIQWWISSISENCGTYVTKGRYGWGHTFNITLDINNVLEYSEIQDIDLTSATKAILAHEILHIVLGHFSSKYKDYNRYVMNIAGDLEINQLINLKRPGIQIEDFGFKLFRNAEYYYNLLIDEYNKKLEEKKEESRKILQKYEHESDESDSDDMGDVEIESPTKNDSEEDNECNSGESFNKNEEDEDEDVNNDLTISNFDDNKSENQSDNIDESNTGSIDINSESIIDSIIEEQAIKEVLEEMLPEGVEINTNTSDKLEQNDETIDLDVSNADSIKIENKIISSINTLDNTFNIKGLNEIIRKIENEENKVKIIPHDRKATYYRLNNRRKSDFILPGKRFENDGIKRKYDNSPVVFIDVSGSTCGAVYKNLMNTAKRLYKIGATIIYYTAYIEGIIEPSDKFFTVGCGGGTNIQKVIGDYLKDFKPFTRAYIFTDGCDCFGEMKNVCEKFNIYYIDREKTVYEKYNERSEIPYWG